MKKKICFFIVLVFVFLQWAELAEGAISTTERAALIALYTNTNGDNWTNKSGWKTSPLHSDGFAMPGTEGTWQGISVASNRVTWLIMGSNHLSGTIPSQLGNLTALKGFDLHDNQLRGSIPSQLGNLIYLGSLQLSNNQLTGSIPSQLGNITGIEWLMLNNNQLSGTIPSQLGNLSKMTYLQLHNNQLSGSIPSSIGNLTKLMTLTLAHNSLTGVIPTTLTNLTQIITLDLAYNCLSATNAALRTWLNAHDADWEATQCLTVPAVTTDPVSSITTANAVCGGHVTADGGSTVTERGICWSTTANPTYNDSRNNSGVGTGSFICDITGLNANTTYYVRAFAINSLGAGYGDNVSFTTPSDLPELLPPFGSFATPDDGVTVAGSIAVTGWALDDSGLANVKIYRAEGYIGDALFVEGARPDVALAYPEYPANTKAGWGYMLLTNFLPDGPITLTAIATDVAGKTTELGSKTITIDNAHAVKPFGAIDSPAQGGIASGSSYQNNGWVLTPMPNAIPTTGATINVYVDGGLLGHAHYNLYRSDIAELFPGYANSNNAWGYSNLDTTQYSNGIHTIQWTATDNVGNTDGIGSRYFSIQNTSSDTPQRASTQAIPVNFQQIATLPEYASAPVYFSTGFNGENECRALFPAKEGTCPMTIQELERVEIQLGQNYTAIQGYAIHGSQLKPLPIGSTLDAKGGTFSWSPGPGFLGNYSLVFVLTDDTGFTFKKTIEITIEPKFSHK